MSRRLLYLLILFVLAGLLLFVPLPIPPTYAGRTIENAGHTPLFFLVTLGVLFVMRDHPRFPGARLYALAGLIGVGAGFLSEVIQRPLARDASWEDVVADAVGVVCALARRMRCSIAARSLRAWQRLGALAVALSCIAIFLTPIVRMTRAYVHRNGQFPVLADFHSRIELYWTLSIGVNREIVDDALEVDLVADEFPGVSFHEPVPDWRALQDPGHRRGESGCRAAESRRARARPPSQPQPSTTASTGASTWRPASGARCGYRWKTSGMGLDSGSWTWRISRTSHCFAAVRRARATCVFTLCGWSSALR